MELVKQYAHDGLACCVLKGQGNLVNYPEHLRECRTAGGIDVWCAPQDSCGIDIAVADLDGRGAHYEKYHGNWAVIEYVKMLWRVEGSNGSCAPVGAQASKLGANGTNGSTEFTQWCLDTIV